MEQTVAAVGARNAPSPAMQHGEVPAAVCPALATPRDRMPRLHTAGASQIAAKGRRFRAIGIESGTCATNAEAQPRSRAG